MQGGIRDDLKPADSAVDHASWRLDRTLIPAADLDDVPGVLAEQRKVERCFARARNGIWWFNRFYLAVTDGVWKELVDHEYGPAGDRFLRMLDIEFYGLYRNALCETDGQDAVRVAWEPLFERRNDHLHPVFFVLTGVNAHIICDLPQALVNTLLRMGMGEMPAIGSPEHAAYEGINQVLYRISAGCLRDDFTSGLPRLAYSLFPQYLTDLGNAYIRIVRDLAWQHARSLWSVRADAAAFGAMRMMLATSASSCNRWLLQDGSFGPDIGIAEVQAWIASRLAGVHPLKAIAADLRSLVSEVGFTAHPKPAGETPAF